MTDLFAGLDALTFRQRSRRQAALDVSLIQQGVIGGKTSSPASRQPSSGKPRTGGKPKAGARPIDLSAQEEMRKKRPDNAGAGGGGARAFRILPKTSSGAPASRKPQSAADLLAVKRAMAAGSQNAVVKLASFAGGGGRIGALMAYQSHDGELALEREDGSTVQGREALTQLARSWADESPERQPSSDVMHFRMTLEGVRPIAEVEAALEQALAGHRYAWRTEFSAPGTGIEVVASAAAKGQGEGVRGSRVYDNRKSLAQFEGRLDRAFGTDTHFEERGFAHGVEGASRYLSRLTKGGAIAAQTGTGTVLTGHDANLAEAKSWKRDLRSREQRDVAHVILSAKPGTDKDAFVEAARATLASEFAGHKFAFALHTNREHMHVHVVVKMTSETDERIHPNVGDFHRWRQTLAREARERHIPMQAPRRFDQANPPGYKLKDIKRVERGTASEPVRRRVEAVRTKAVHVPTREEGRKRANEAAAQWRSVQALVGLAGAVPPLASGAMRLYRVDRRGAAETSAPLFMRDLAGAEAMASRSGGTLSYVDVPASRLGELQPARKAQGTQFVVGAALASERKPLEHATNPDIYRFVNRTELAARTASQREFAASIQIREGNEVANSQTMKKAYAELDAQLTIIGKNLPDDRAAEFNSAKQKIAEQQRVTLDAQERIERNRGSVEGEGYVAPKPRNFTSYVVEQRGEQLRYAHRYDDGTTGRVAFTDTGQKVEVNDWKDRESTLAAMQLAAEKWGALTIRGPEKYKAMTVQLAAEHGFQIANPELQQQLQNERERVQRERDAQPGFERGAPPSQPGSKEGQMDDAGEKPPAPVVERTLAADPRPESTLKGRPGFVEGEIVGEGTSPYRNEKDASQTPHVDIRTDRGVTRVWGVALPEALAEAGVEKGDRIAIAIADREQVMKEVKVKDEETGGCRVESQKVWRNNWSVEIQERAKQEERSVQAESAPGAQSDLPHSGQSLRAPGEREIALSQVRERTESEAAREVHQYRESARTDERPIDGGGQDHAYRTKAEAVAALRAERAVDSNRSIPADINQTLQVERLRQEQDEVLKEKAETDKQKQTQQHTQRPHRPRM